MSTPTTPLSAAASGTRPGGARPQVNGAFGRAGVEALSLSTDEDLVRAIVRMAALRRRRRR